jgi:hypothetical protein
MAAAAGGAVLGGGLRLAAAGSHDRTPSVTIGQKQAARAINRLLKTEPEGKRKGRQRYFFSKLLN